LLHDLYISKQGEHLSNSYHIGALNLNLQRVLPFPLQVDIFHFSQRALEMEIPWDFNIKHDFVYKSIQAGEVSGLVLAAAIMLSFLRYFLLAPFPFSAVLSLIH